MENNQNEPQNEPVNYKGKGINGALVAIILIMGAVILALLAYIAFKPTEVAKEETETKKETVTVHEEDEEEEIVEEDEEDEEEEKEETKSSLKVKNEVTETKKSDVNLKVKNEVSEVKTVVDNSEISSEWRSTEFILDGVKYTLYDDYSKFVSNGWTIDLVEMGYPDGYILNKHDKLSTIIDFNNPKYEGADVNVGFVNLGEGPKDVTECQIWSIDIDNYWSDTEVKFTLPGGITNGSTRAEVEAAYGVSEDIYESDLGYVVLDYETAYEEDDFITFSVTVDNEKGVVGFDMSNYTVD